MTIRDIAREAGVSTATVSRALNGLTVKEESRRKVAEAVKKLDYVPNYLARGLSNKRSFAIGVLVTSMTNSYYMEITEAIEKRLSERGFVLFLCSTGLDPAREAGYLSELLKRRVDGCILADPDIGNYRSGLLPSIARRMPLVLIHPDPEIRDINSVVVDQASGMRQVMDYLMSLGHKDIAFVRGRKGHSYDIKEEVWRGRGPGLVPGRDEPSPRLVVIEEGNSAEAIRQAEEACLPLLSSERRPTAVFACNDLMARGVLRAADRSGLRVPEDLSVIGHDDSLLAKSGRFGLTTVDLKMRSLGRAAADLLLHAIEGEDPEPRRVLIEPSLVLRETAGPASLGNSLTS